MTEIIGNGFAYDTQRRRLRVLARIAADVDVTVDVDTVRDSDELHDKLAKAADTDDARMDAVHEWLTDADNLDNVIAVGAGRVTPRQVRLDDTTSYSVELDHNHPDGVADSDE
jgi:hypothetical protein